MLGSHRALLKLKAQSHCSLSRLHRMGCGKDPLAIGKEPAESKGWPKEDSNDWRTSSQGLHVFACEELREWCHLSAQAVIMPQPPHHWRRERERPDYKQTHSLPLWG